MIKVLLIDDEKSSLRYLKNLIEENFKELDILATINNPIDGIEAIETLQPDLIFLDIEMPFYSGFEMLKKLDKITFEIIFVTAFANYAINAFDFCAIGYIIKPVSASDLSISISNAKKRILQKKFQERAILLLNNIDQPDHPNHQICISSKDGMTFINIKDIIRCEGISKATKIILAQQKIIFSSYNIGRFVKLLTPHNFLVTHKSHIINRKCVDFYSKNGYIQLKNGTQIPVAKRRKKEIMKELRL